MFVRLSYDTPGGDHRVCAINADEVRTVELFPADVKDGETRDLIVVVFRNDPDRALRIQVEAYRGYAIYTSLLDAISRALGQRATTLSFIAFPSLTASLKAQ